MFSYQFGLPGALRIQNVISASDKFEVGPTIIQSIAVSMIYLHSAWGFSCYHLVHKHIRSASDGITMRPVRPFELDQTIVVFVVNYCLSALGEWNSFQVLDSSTFEKSSIEHAYHPFKVVPGLSWGGTIPAP